MKLDDKRLAQIREAAEKYLQEPYQEIGTTKHARDVIAMVDEIERLRRVEKAAKTLRANALGLRIEEAGVRALVGNTNWHCVEYSCEELEKALSEDGKE